MWGTLLGYWQLDRAVGSEGKASVYICMGKGQLHFNETSGSPKYANMLLTTSTGNWSHNFEWLSSSSVDQCLYSPGDTLILGTIHMGFKFSSFTSPQWSPCSYSPHFPRTKTGLKYFEWVHRSALGRSNDHFALLLFINVKERNWWEGWPRLLHDNSPWCIQGWRQIITISMIYNSYQWSNYSHISPCNFYVAQG